MKGINNYISEKLHIGADYTGLNIVDEIVEIIQSKYKNDTTPKIEEWIKSEGITDYVIYAYYEDKKKIPKEYADKAYLYRDIDVEIKGPAYPDVKTLDVVWRELRGYWHYIGKTEGIGYHGQWLGFKSLKWGFMIFIYGIK